jgi:hypothetical protein
MSLLMIDPEPFAENFDRHPFYIAHSLGEHALFDLRELAALSGRLRPRLVEWNDGHGDAYGKPDETRAARLSCAQTILDVAEHPAWVLLRNVQEDPLYGALLDELLDQIKPYSEPIYPGMTQREGFIFVSSREAVTPYHFDPEYNFLLQVRGSKTVHMWSAADRRVLPAAAIDDFYAYEGPNRNQPYREDFLDSAWNMPLAAGQGLHFPLHAPHWVKTDSDVSISFSITFRTRRSKYREPIHAANGIVRRRLGVEPPAPGTSMAWDAAAHVGYRALRKSRSLIGAARRKLSQQSDPLRQG